MCGLIVTNRQVDDWKAANYFCKRRGPDLTTIETVEGITFVHHQLHITGKVHKQPFFKDGYGWVFNGEIYNYRDLGSYDTDGDCIIDAYKNDQMTDLDSEHAIVIADFEGARVTAFTDVFNTKPLWYGHDGREFCIASYKSSVKALGFRPKRLRRRMVWRFYLNSGNAESYGSRYEFDIEQKKDTYDDWITAFESAIRKRITGVGRYMFMGLSSGYDSGGIACEMAKQNAWFEAYTVMATETQEIVKARHEKLENGVILQPRVEDYKRVREYIRKNCEGFKYKDRFNKYDIKKDKASVGLGMICELAQAKDQRVYFSGQGSDEIMSDYGFNGRRMMSHSEFGGKFPKSLKGFFPWHSFFDGTQIKYLNKEEYVAGCYGIETRYPYLDRALAQEFLWLTPELKNRHYKAPLHEYLKRNDYPFEEGVKKGFRAKDNLK